MRPNTDHLDEGRVGLLAGALLALVALEGCGGGGGGGGGGGTTRVPDPGFSYPTSLMAATTADIGGFSGASTLNRATNTLTSIAPGLGATLVVTLNTPAAGAYTVTVSGIPLPATIFPEPPFNFVVSPANPTLAAGSKNVAGSGCSNCFRTGTVTASDGQTVAFTDLDLTTALFTYSTLGLWSKPSLSLPGTTDVGGAFSFGVLTRGVDLPTTGTATYNGPMVGRYANGTEVFTVGAAATATANFGAAAVGPVGPRSVAFSTSGTATTSALGTIALNQNHLNLTGTFAYTPGLNQLNSTSFTSAGTGVAGSVMSGTASAAFYGPPSTTTPFAPPEFGGAFAVTNGTNQSMVGSFVLKK
jgi:hypothetical protein